MSTNQSDDRSSSRGDLELLGIHHITAIATDPQANLDFYGGLLGLRLVKKTVNFDDPGTYHFYYGDDLGRPGTILTFFPWPMARRGSRGAGQATETAFSVAAGSLGYWAERLDRYGITREDPQSRFGGDEEVLTFLDPDGMKLELVAHQGAEERPGWQGGPVPAEHAIRGFFGVTLTESDPAPTAGLLTGVMGFTAAGEDGDRHRFRVGPGDPSGAAAGALVDLRVSPGASHGRVAAGSVHHVAWRTADEAAEEGWRARLAGAGQHVTPILDRQYFRSIYFREPGGVLFELATDPPGFTLDETPEELGGGLKLPPWLEGQRERIEEVLPPVTEPRLDLAAEEVAS